MKTTSLLLGTTLAVGVSANLYARVGAGSTIEGEATAFSSTLKGKDDHLQSRGWSGTNLGQCQGTAQQLSTPAVVAPPLVAAAAARLVH